MSEVDENIIIEKNEDIAFGKNVDVIKIKLLQNILKELKILNGK